MCRATDKENICTGGEKFMEGKIYTDGKPATDSIIHFSFQSKIFYFWFSFAGFK